MQLFPQLRFGKLQLCGMYNKDISGVLDPSPYIVFEIKQVDRSGVGLHLIMNSKLLYRPVNDGRRFLAKQIVFENGDHQAFETGSVGNQDDKPVFRKQLVDEPEGCRLDVRNTGLSS